VSIEEVPVATCSETGGVAKVDCWWC